MDEFDIAIADPRIDDVRQLVEHHLKFGRLHSPPQDVHALEVDDLLDPGVTLFGVRCRSELVAIGALKRLDDQHAELKTMHTVEHVRGQGIGRAMLDHLLAVARERGFQRVSLETGVMDAFAPARSLYVSAGFVPCEPFGDYRRSPSTTYMTMRVVGLELVIFDCDGVLVDSEVISNRVLAAMLTEQGLPTTLPQARQEYQGLLLADVIARAEAKLGRSLPDDWLARYETERTDAFRRELQPVIGAVETIERLCGAGLHVCVASQGKPEKTRLSLALTGLDHLFPESVRFSAYSVANGKPAPDLFLYAAATIGVEPAACVVVEDTPSGVQAAVAAGMRAIGYTADSDESALREAGAELLGSLDELPRLLLPMSSEARKL